MRRWKSITSDDRQPIHRKEYEELRQEYQMRRTEAEVEQAFLYQTQEMPELQFSLFEYFPEAHYQNAFNAYDQLLNQPRNKAIVAGTLEEAELQPDGGTPNHLHGDGRRSTVYYWINPDTGAALYHTEINGREADPFFSSVGDAEQFLEQTTGDNQEEYQGMSLYKAKISKVEDAVEVLTNQSGIMDF